MNKNLEIFSDADALSQAAADYFLALADSAIQQRGQFTVALSGGNTPTPLYRVLGTPKFQKAINWDHIHFFWGDERCVPPDHPNSNYRMVREVLLQKISIPEENVHRVPAELEPRMAAFAYEEVLRNYFFDEWPRFDLVLLGMGEDGHTASLFPNSAGLNETHRWFIANHAPEKDEWRLTLTKNAINAARHIAVIVTGDSKAATLIDVLEGEHQQHEKPIQLIAPGNGEMVWFLDQTAAKKLSD